MSKQVVSSPLWILICTWLVTLSGCATHQYETTPQSPAPVAVQGNTTYESRNIDGADDLADLCAIDPEACPADARGADKMKIGEATVSVEASSDEEGIALAGPLAGAPAAARSLFGGEGDTKPAALPPQPIQTGKGGGDASAQGEMLDIEARVTLEVDTISGAVTKIRTLVSSARGRVVNDVLEDNASSAGAALSVRVPSETVHWFLDALSRVGKLRSRKVETKDIGREYRDAQTLLRNLEETMQRYEQLLKKATTVKDMVTIEAALARVRTRLDRVKGDLRYMKDRAARSTVYITLNSEADSEAVAPEAKLHPGVRGVFALDFPTGGSSDSYGGAGFSLFFLRAFNMDADFMGKLDGGGESGIDLFIATLGSELYSDFLGGGQRRFLNPYLGFRGGYVRNLGENELALGGSLGVELVKTSALTLDLHTRAYAFLGTSARGAHPVLEPGLAIHFSY